MKAIVVLFSMFLLYGCMTVPNVHQFEPVAPQVMAQSLPAAPVIPANGAIYQADHGLHLFEDRTARRPGDILTVLLVERINASKSANSAVDKSSTTSLPNPLLFGQLGALGANDLQVDIEGSRDFSGGGQSNQSNSLNGQISAVVTHIYPNGNLGIRGEKMLTLNQGEEYVQLAGMVRPDDIAPDNSVLSTQVADAKITYGGTGALADANASGWLQRFFLSPLWPF
jgi:flagellar L-ring protein precursor FlgH